MSDELVIACVRTGTKYGMEYVTKLRNMVARHMTRPYTLVCLTDQAERCEGAVFIDVKQTGLHGWWAKMILFEPEWRGRSQIIFFDLDTVIIGDVAPLADVPGEFAILESPVRLAGNLSYPCHYNSSCMVIGGGRCGFVWSSFQRRRSTLMLAHDRYGDQAAIEELYPEAPYLQQLMPRGFFCNYRNLKAQKPETAAVINFGGRAKPANCGLAWVQAEWL